MSATLTCTLSGVNVEATHALCPGCGNIIIANDGVHIAPGAGPVADSPAAPLEPPPTTEPAPGVRPVSAATEQSPLPSEGSRAGFAECPGCGRSVDADAAECTWCGETIAAGVDRTHIAFPNGLTIVVEAPELVLGRLSPDPRIGRAVDFDHVSRRHAALHHRDGMVFLSDLGSAHGTTLNGSPVTTEQRLPTGHHEVVLGGAVTIRMDVP